METDPQNAVVFIQNTPNTNDGPRKKKKASAMHVIKAAFSMMGKSSPKSKALPKDNESKSVWRKLVGSMRPLHLQNTQSPRANNDDEDGSQRHHHIQITAPPSEGGAEEERLFTPHSRSPASSRYASAVGLNEMVAQSDDEEIKEEEGDKMIDAKADDFIAEFYKQMRIQRMDSNTDRFYRERSRRSLGA